MIDFDSARKEAFLALQKLYTTVNVTENYDNKPYFVEIWKSTVEFLAGDLETEIDILICIDSSFPLTFPKLYLDDKSYRLLNYPLPHVTYENTADFHFICTYDLNTNIPVPSENKRIIPKLIERAKEILALGHEGKNIDDFKDEFIHYWAENYREKNSISQRWLSITTSKSPKHLSALFLNSHISGIERILFETEAEIFPIRQFLETQKIDYEQHEILYLGKINFLIPPFFKTNFEAVQLVKSLGKEHEFNRYFKNGRARAVIFSTDIRDRTIFLGWIHKQPILNKNGFRVGRLLPSQVFSKWQKDEEVQRLYSRELTNERLKFRSMGLLKNEVTNSFLLVGTGSIGSNLLNFLITLPISKIGLIDPDTFTLDNLPRHILGMVDLNESKVDGLEKYIKNRMPLVMVEKYEDNVVSVFRDNIALPNSFDYVFISIADLNSEIWISDLIEEGKITKPCFFFFLEPYFAGGHCIYFHPQNSNNLRSFFDAGVYKFNVLNSENTPNLVLRDPACQTTFTPFSSSDLTFFLSKIYPYLFQIMHSDDKSSKRFVWFGNIPYLLSEGIPIKEEFKMKKYGEVEAFDL